MVEFEWDESKRLTNIDKHGLDFEDADQFFDGRPQRTVRDTRFDEMRFVTTCEFETVFYTVVWTRRGEAIRIISLRRARRAEERAYRALHSERAAGEA